MKNKIELLEERINYLNNVVGDLDTMEFQVKPGPRGVAPKEKPQTIAEVIIHLQKEISENDSITFKDIYKKCNINSYL